MSKYHAPQISSAAAPRHLARNECAQGRRNLKFAEKTIEKTITRRPCRPGRARLRSATDAVRRRRGRRCFAPVSPVAQLQPEAVQSHITTVTHHTSQVAVTIIHPANSHADSRAELRAGSECCSLATLAPASPRQPEPPSQLLCQSVPVQRQSYRLLISCYHEQIWQRTRQHRGQHQQSQVGRAEGELWLLVTHKYLQERQQPRAGVWPGPRAAGGQLHQLQPRRAGQALDAG